MTSFFDYYCDQCNTPYCERVWIMNLALDNLDEAYCLTCLSQMNTRPPEEFAQWIGEYIQSRDCFKTPWDNFNAAACPALATQTCCSTSSSKNAIQ